LFEKGFDPADFTLVAFGGAGGLHAVALAEELGMMRIVFPRSAGTLSAFGMLWTDIVHHTARSRILPALPQSLDALRQNAELLLAEGRAALGADGIDEEFWELTLSADMRYVGQGYELTIPWSGLDLHNDSLAACIAAFHEAHRARFLHADESEPVEIVTLRVAARGRLERPRAVAPDLPSTTGDTTDHPVYIDGEWLDLPVHSRSEMMSGNSVDGPLLIAEEFTTILVSSGWQVEMRPTGDLVAERT
jgi:N-methylhydantoinase A